MVKHTIQEKRNECGIACLKMFYDLFEVKVSYEDLVNAVYCDKEGVTIDDMVIKLNNLGLFKAYKLDNYELVKSMTPSICLIKRKKASHYVVIWKYESGYFYVSDPNFYKIKKVKEKVFLKYFSGIIIFNQKREVQLPIYDQYKVKMGGFTIPYIILSLLEVFLITYSMMYLFSIRDFTAFKIYYFLIMLVINFFISSMKNICFNFINKSIDNNTIDLKIKNNFRNGKINNVNDLRVNIQRGYNVKNDYILLLINIIPNIFIIFGTLIYFFSISLGLFVLSIVIYFLLFIINFYFSLKKNKRLRTANQEEYRLNKFNDKVLSKSTKETIVNYIDKIKQETSKYNTYTQINGLILFSIKQFSLMIILLFMYLSKIEIYSIFVVTFYFYSFEGIINISEFISKSRDRISLRRQFLSE